MRAYTPSPTSVTVVGTFQQAIGCNANWQADSPRTRLTFDPAADLWRGTFALPPGSYRFKVALNDSWRENYGAGATRDGADIPLVLTAAESVTFIYDHRSHWLSCSAAGSPHGNLSQASAHWVARNLIAWPPAGSDRCSYWLHGAPDGSLLVGPHQVRGGTDIPLRYDPVGLPADLLARFPHLAGSAALVIADEHVDTAIGLLTGQIAVSVASTVGIVLEATGVQIPGVLDDLFPYDGPLGATFTAGIPTLRLWAPTARRVSLRLFASPRGAEFRSIPMARDAATGVWSAIGDETWIAAFYLYEVDVYVRATDRVERNLVTDPYSFSLSANGARSQIVDLNDPALKPGGWDTLQKPPLAGFHDIALYELHVRDFSWSDSSVPEPLRGTFRAFALQESRGMRHLQTLAEAGLTHIHLLPVSDFATVEELRSLQHHPDEALLRSYPPDSQLQQSLVSAARFRDAFNWGYDPQHFTVPEGSYATDPDGWARVWEFREMVQGLALAGLRVVMDVVYNHTYAGGQSDMSVLDRVVPGYYHRLDERGNVCHSTCCENTATEHAMMRKLMLDSLRTWATAYKVDGFRFDLMGHHMAADLLAVRDMLRSLTLERDGVDGQSIYLYGEGWDFGEVAFNARGVNATQRNMAGTGVATFNDRLRDAVRGGGSSDGVQEQGFITGLSYEPNGITSGTAAAQLERLLLAGDHVKVGLAGNLSDYHLEDHSGHMVVGALVPYHGQATGYATEPTETITYIEAHDNETLWDAIQLKAAPEATVEDRVRMQCLGLSLVLLGQGVPFLHAGQDLLRSKSCDRNSYNSGDWFNRLDFSYQSNNWGVGLPPGESEHYWPLARPLLANPALRVRPDDIRFAAEHTREMLRIRRSSRLFRLGSAAQVRDRLLFLNTGPRQLPGLIAMLLDGSDDPVLEQPFRRIMVLFNVRPSPQSITVPSLAGTLFTLHPIQSHSNDLLVRQATCDTAEGAFTVPARTTAVFVG